MNRTEEELIRDLADGAEVFEERGGRDRTMLEVVGTARSIQRRRRAGTALVAAAVLAAVAVPVGLTVGNQSATAPPPATTTTPTPRPVERIALGDLPVGAAPSTGWVSGNTWHAADGQEHLVLPTPTHAGDSSGDGQEGPVTVTGAALVGDALVATVSTRGGGTQAVLVRPGQDAASLGPTSGGITASSSPERVAFVTPDGKRVTVVSEDGGGIQTLTGPGIGEGALQPAAVTGQDCTVEPPGCIVWLNDLGVGQKVMPVISSPTLDLAATPRIRTLADVAPDGRKAGIVSRTPGGTCSEVQQNNGHRLWKTCAARFVSFAPDGARLLGTSAYGDGMGDTQLTVFDASTGGSVMDLRTARDAAITEMAWEDDTHVLAVVVQGQRTGIVRIGVDGRAEYAVPPVTAPDGTSPFVLPNS